MAGPFTAVNSHGVHIDKTGSGGSSTTDVPDVTKWTVNPKAENLAYASSSTGGWKKRMAGTLDVSGSIDVKCNDTDKIESFFKPGEKIAVMELYMNETLKYSGPAIIDDISVETDIDTGAIISATINFSGDGPWTAFQ